MITTNVFNSAMARASASPQQDVETARKERDERFIRQAYHILKRLARRQEFVHVNDFWDAVDRLKTAPLPEPSDRRVLGQAFNRLARDGGITATDMAKKSIRHGNYWRTVWRSNVYVPRKVKETV